MYIIEIVYIVHMYYNCSSIFKNTLMATDSKRLKINKLQFI